MATLSSWLASENSCYLLLLLVIAFSYEIWRSRLFNIIRAIKNQKRVSQIFDVSRDAFRFTYSRAMLIELLLCRRENSASRIWLSSNVRSPWLPRRDVLSQTAWCMRRPAATETLKESTMPFIGILQCKSIFISDYNRSWARPIHVVYRHLKIQKMEE